MIISSDMSLEALVKYCSFETSIPEYGKVQNPTELAANLFLHPTRIFLGVLVIKEPSYELLSLVKKAGAVAILIILTPLALIGMILRGIGYLLPHETYGDDRTDLSDCVKARYTSPTKIELCYELAETFTKVCKENGFVDAQGIPLFCIQGGNTLGSLRHGGMIPGDDDIDLFVNSEHEARIVELKSAFSAAGFEWDDSMRSVHGLYKLRFTREKLDKFPFPVEENDNPDIDVAVCDRMSDGSYTYSSTLRRATYPNDYFSREEFEGGFEEAPYGPPHLGLRLPGLKRAHGESYVKRYYGEDCLDYGILTHGHFRLNLGCCELALPFFKKDAHRFRITNHTPAQGCYRWKE